LKITFKNLRFQNKKRDADLIEEKKRKRKIWVQAGIF